MKNIISFSLYGNNPKYCVGMQRNLELAPAFYPGWICRIYYNNTVPQNYIETFKEKGAELIDMSNTPLNEFGMFWRFLIYNEQNVERFVIRDTDSRPSKRESAAVNEWIKSGKSLHIMRDHPFHNAPILGGTWGLKNDFKFNIEELINQFTTELGVFKYDDDQKFLKFIYNSYIDNMICHDDFFNWPHNVKFPTKRINNEFIGQVFDENEETVQEHQDLLKAYLKPLPTLKRKIKQLFSQH